MALVEDLGADMLRDLQLFRRDEDEFDVLIPGHGGDERMDGPAELEVSAEADGQIVQSALLTVDGEQVSQRLGGVVVTAVTGVDHGDAGSLGSHIGSTLSGVAHGDDVSIAADGLGCVGHALALGGGGGLGFGEADDIAAQLVHGGLKAQTGTGGGLEEQGSQLLVLAAIPILFRICNNIVSRFYKQAL